MFEVQRQHFLSELRRFLNNDRESIRCPGNEVVMLVFFQDVEHLLQELWNRALLEVAGFRTFAGILCTSLHLI